MKLSSLIRNAVAIALVAGLTACGGGGGGSTATGTGGSGGSGGSGGTGGTGGTGGSGSTEWRAFTSYTDSDPTDVVLGDATLYLRTLDGSNTRSLAVYPQSASVFAGSVHSYTVASGVVQSASLDGYVYADPSVSRVYYVPATGSNPSSTVILDYSSMGKACYLSEDSGYVSLQTAGSDGSCGNADDLYKIMPANGGNVIDGKWVGAVFDTNWAVSKVLVWAPASGASAPGELLAYDAALSSSTQLVPNVTTAGAFKNDGRAILLSLDGQLSVYNLNTGMHGITIASGNVPSANDVKKVTVSGNTFYIYASETGATDLALYTLPDDGAKAIAITRVGTMTGVAGITMDPAHRNGKIYMVASSSGSSVVGDKVVEVDPATANVTTLATATPRTGGAPQLAPCGWRGDWMVVQDFDGLDPRDSNVRAINLSGSASNQVLMTGAACAGMLFRSSGAQLPYQGEVDYVFMAGIDATSTPLDVKESGVYAQDMTAIGNGSAPINMDATMSVNGVLSSYSVTRPALAVSTDGSGLPGMTADVYLFDPMASAGSRVKPFATDANANEGVVR